MDEQTTGVTIAEALREAAAILREAGTAEARREAGSLLTHVLKRDRAFLFTHDDERLSPEDLSVFRRAVRRRADGEPLQYITGRQEFYGLDFEVTPDVLIPRPETELLVETALELLRETESPLVCDVGTGSGCVVVSLLKERNEARAHALDISAAALRVAERNAARHGVHERVAFRVSDCFDALRADGSKNARFDIVVSNPPYIAEADISGLQREVCAYEPRAALTPGGDGLDVIRRLVAEAPRFLESRGHLVFEIGFDQSDAVEHLIDPHTWTLLDIRRDLQGIPRTGLLRLKQ
ncbi:MAG TPA: peptide chain release factor N(5)-glutamine methyltransferase [Pyrinomonadaceae bacterium]|nr:peptide chain release factor N(5)-glutamine methyltransferase [Pyrinomonadaceae bacterium]